MIIRNLLRRSNNRICLVNQRFGIPNLCLNARLESSVTSQSHIKSKSDPRNRRSQRLASIRASVPPNDAFQVLANEDDYAKVKKIPKYQQLSHEEKALRYISRHKFTTELLRNVLHLSEELYNDHIKAATIDISTATVEELFNIRLMCIKLAMEECFERRKVKFFRKISGHLFPKWRPENNAKVTPVIRLFWDDLLKLRNYEQKYSVEGWDSWIPYVAYARDPPIIPSLCRMEKAMAEFGLKVVDKQNTIKVYNLATVEILCKSFSKFFMTKVYHNREYNPNEELKIVKGVKLQVKSKADLEYDMKESLKGKNEPTSGLSIESDVENRLEFEPEVKSSSKIKTKPNTPLAPALGVLDLENPAWLFPAARAIRRKVYLHIGPTNSGKTYNALKAFQAANSGFYAGPLRLLAREIYNRMKSIKKPCSLVTGEEVIEEFDENGNPAQLSSGTVEMMDINRQMDIAVLDEIQMIEDIDRGWAWTQAFLAVQAKEVHLCGDPNTKELVKRLAAQAGDELEIIEYNRLSPLQVEENELSDDLNQLQPGDCLVFFSKRHILAAKNMIESETGKKCAVIYGSLPAETRAKQAESFNDPNSDVKFLVASDAIGMGLNLAIRRVIFSKVRKFNGKSSIKIPIAQVKQIAGRAGRFQVAPNDQTTNQNQNVSNIGYVTSLNRRDKAYIEECLALPSPPVTQAVFFPLDSIIHEFVHFIGPNVPYHQILSHMEGSIKLPPLYKFADLSNMVSTSKIFSKIKGLMLQEIMTLSKAPVSSTDDLVKSAFYSFCLIIANGQSKTINEIANTGVGYLGSTVISTAKPSDTLESVHRVLTLYLWLSYRFPTHFLDRTGAMQLKTLCEQRINDLLKKSPHIKSIVGRKTHKHETNSTTRSLNFPPPTRSHRPTVAAFP